MEQYDPLSRTLLKLTSILMTVFGVFGIVLYLLALGVLLGVNYMTAGVFSALQDIIGLSLLLAASIAELIGGRVGRKTLKNPQKASRCRVWGILTLILGLAGLVHILVRSGNPAYWVSIPLALVTPVLYLIGAAGMWHPLPAEEEEDVPET